MPASNQSISPAASANKSRLFEARDLTFGGLLCALGIVLPAVFHAAGPMAGKVFMPMYLPILALGLCVSWEVALLAGFLTPLLSAVLTGMPPLAPPIALLMMFELATLAAVASLGRSAGLSVWPASIVAIIAARVVGVLALLTAGRMLGFNQGVWEYAILSLAISWPGIILQLSVVPGAVYAIEKASMLGSRRADG